MNQLTLFDDGPKLARASDPVQMACTSTAPAASSLGIIKREWATSYSQSHLTAA